MRSSTRRCVRILDDPSLLGVGAPLWRPHRSHGCYAFPLCRDLTTLPNSTSSSIASRNRLGAAGCSPHVAVGSRGRSEASTSSWKTARNGPNSGLGPRIVRVGTHALKAGSSTTLWKRLSQHKGQEKSGGGNHRGSIFRLIVGTALNTDEPSVCPTWGQGNTADRSVRAAEAALEVRVSRVIGSMRFAWLAIDDEAGPASMRGYIERNAIALLSNYGKPAIDLPSPGWLGHKCNRAKVRASGLWNQNHVDEFS